MKFSLILLSFLALSCGKIGTTSSGSNTVGESRSINAFSVVSDTDRNNLNVVCNSAAAKSAILPSVVGATYNWSSSTSDCAKKVTNEFNVETIIQNTGTNFVFKRKDNNQDFIFADVETNTSGILADACSLLNGGQQNPVVSGSNASYISTSAISSSDCQPTSGEICVSIERASQQGDQFVVHTKDWLRVRVSSPTNERIGFVTQRKKVTRGSCGTDQVLQFEASLK